MNYKVIGRYLGLLLITEGVFLIPPALISLFLHESNAFYAILATILLAAIVGGVLFLLCRKCKREFYAKDGLVLVALAWFVLSAFGALPFTLSGEIPNYIDALFEIISGFTTTGASILTDIEAVSKGLLFWRSFTHWLGGMGILVFIMAIEPSGKGKGNSFSLHVMRAESPGPSVGKLVPKIGLTAKILYALYIALTALCIGMLLLGGMPVFDSFCIAFGTAGTGGFGILNDSMASYSPYLQTVVTVFMALFGINFSVYYLFLRNPRAALRDEEVRTYLLIMLGAILLITLNIYFSATDFGSFKECLHSAAFHVSSIMTTTGFSIADYNLWPSFSKWIILLLMLLGACAGSTGGGIKIARFLLIFKSMRAGFKRMLHPRSVQVITLNGKPVEDGILQGLWVYLSAYAVIFVISTLLISLDGFSVLTNLSATLSCLGNIGPGLDTVGPAGNFASFSWFSKIVLSLDMLFGRLEIFPLIALFSHDVYRRRNINIRRAL